MSRSEPASLEILVRIEARLELVGWSGLSEAEQNFRAVWRFHVELATAGITQFLRDIPAAHLPVVVRGLDAVGAFHTRQLLLEAIPLVSTSPEGLDSVLAQITSALRSSPEDLRALLAAYLEREAASF